MFPLQNQSFSTPIIFWGHSILPDSKMKNRSSEPSLEVLSPHYLVIWDGIHVQVQKQSTGRDVI